MANNLHHELLDGCYVRMLGGGKAAQTQTFAWSVLVWNTFRVL